MSRILSVVLGTALALLALSTHANLPDKKVLTLEAAKKIAAAAKLEAEKRKATVVIAVVDDGGYLLLLERLNDTQVASVDVGIGKARTAAIFRRPSKVFEDQVKNGRVAAIALPGATPLQGGLPIMYDGKVVGAIGVSGNTPQEDEDIAQAGVDAAKSAIEAMNVLYLDKEKVDLAFAKGMPLLEVPGYKVHASRRTQGGLVEIHEHETDVVYVLEGTATFVTGGKIVNPRAVAPGEIRGDDIVGGETRELKKGDFVVVPPNTPHWFKQTSDPLLYYVVKPIEQ